VKAPVEISSGIDRDHKQHDFTELPLLGKLRNEHITSDLAIWRMDHEENWDEHKATGYKRQRETLEPTAGQNMSSPRNWCLGKLVITGSFE
jgi:hypothetical protein